MGNLAKTSFASARRTCRKFSQTADSGSCPPITKRTKPHSGADFLDDNPAQNTGHALALSVLAACIP
tara:strand:- start:14546 stop:14746 length:201 start_codon:yes stop_codon:yes gene_type:complete